MAMAKRTKRDELTTTFARFHDRFPRVEENVSAMYARRQNRLDEYSRY